MSFQQGGAAPLRSSEVARASDQSICEFEMPSVKFDKLKLPSYGQMGGVAFHCSDVQLSANGPRVLLFGGQRQGISGDMYSFEHSSGDGFALLPEADDGPPPAARTQATLTSIGAEPQSELLLFGGFALNIGCMNDVWKCTITLDLASMPVPHWIQLETTGTAPSPRYGHSATYLGAESGLVAIFGGQDTVQQFGDLFVLSSAGAWTSPTVSGPAPSPRMKHTATVVGGAGADRAGACRVLIFGGFHKLERCLSDAYELEMSADGGTARWTALAPEPPVGAKPIPPRAQHAAACSADGRYVFLHGGYDGAKPLTDVWQLDYAAQTLRKLELDMPVPEARSRHTCHMIGDTLHLFGGYDGSKPTAGDVFVLDCADPAAMETEGGSVDKKRQGQEAVKEDHNE